MQTPIFHYPVLIRETHLDTFGHMNNATYLTLFEEARWDLITSRGYGIPQIQQLKLGPTILQLSVRFLKEIKLREQIDIQTSASNCLKKIATMHQAMYRNGELCAEAEFAIGLFDLQERKLVQPTTAWLHAIGYDPHLKD